MATFDDVQLNRRRQNLKISILTDLSDRHI